MVVLASKPVFGPIRLAGTPTGPYAPRSSQLLRRDKLGVVTRAFFNQRDFSETDIVVQFYERLEGSLRTQLTESGLYMGMLCPTPRRNGANIQLRHKPVSCKSDSLNSVLMEFHRRELVHAFRHRTLVLLKALMLQRRVRYSVIFIDHAYVLIIAHLLRPPSRKALHVPIFPGLALPWSAANPRGLWFSLLSGPRSDAQTARGAAYER